MHQNERDLWPLIYVSHPFGEDVDKLHRAECWVTYLVRRFPAIFWAPWIPLCRHWPSHSVEARARGLEFDLAAVRRSDGVILVGGCISPGMSLERDAASNCLDASIVRTPDELCADDVATIEGWIATTTRNRVRSDPPK